MEEYQIPIAKKTLELLYQALVSYRQIGIRELNAEEMIAEQQRARNEIAQAGGDEAKMLGVIFSYPETHLRAKENAWKSDEADLDILIAKVQVLRRRMDGQADTAMVEDFLKEVLK